MGVLANQLQIHMIINYFVLVARRASGAAAPTNE